MFQGMSRLKSIGNRRQIRMGEKRAMRRSAEDTSGFGWFFVEWGEGIVRDSGILTTIEERRQHYEADEGS